MIVQLINKLKRKIKILTGSIHAIKVEVNCNAAWYGNTYGGFYVHPDIMNKAAIVYSFGIGEDISFDRSIIEKHRCQVVGFDPTPKSITWLKNQVLPPTFTFLNYGIANKTGFENFNLPKNKDHVSGSMINHENVDNEDFVSVPMKCFADITAELGHTHIDVLKMDIEGSEYQVIDNILSSPVQIDQILIEFHERFFADGRSKTKKLLQSMKNKGYAVFAVSASFEEVSFIKLKSLR